MKLQSIPDCDILVLSEMWNCPYHNEALKDNFKKHDESLEMLLSIAKEKNMWIIGGSISCKENNAVYNRCYIINNNGKIVCTYDKTHLFELHTHFTYTEREVFTPGDHLQTFDTPWGIMGVLLCYDIRFCEVSRILAQNGARVLFCPAAFNESATKKHWKLLLQSRALENEVYVCGVAPAKYTYKTYTSGGNSMLVSPFGEIVYEMGEQEETKVIDLDLNLIEKARNRMPYWKIRRKDLYSLKENKNERDSNS